MGDFEPNVQGWITVTNKWCILHQPDTLVGDFERNVQNGGVLKVEH